MKNLIIYYSKAGHTKRYAEFLKTRISGDIVSVEKINKKLLLQYDNIFFGSSIRRNNILKIKKFLKYYKKIKDKNLFIFVNGLTTINNDPELRDTLIDMNMLFDKHIRLYILPGGFNYNDISKVEKFLFKIALKASEKQGDSNNLKLLMDQGIDLVNPDALDKMVSVVHTLESNK